MHNRDGRTVLDDDEARLYVAIAKLQAANRAANNSQLMQATGFSHQRISSLTLSLRSAALIRDISSRKSSAYRWRIVPGRDYDESTRSAPALNGQQRRELLNSL